MTAEEIFAVWAPDHSPWSLWAKPVLFAHMTAAPQERQAAMQQTASLPPVPVWLPPASEKVALVIDCPGLQTVEIAMGAAGAGYRPVPLFNALPGPLRSPETEPNTTELSVLRPPPTYDTALVDVWPIIYSLIAFTPVIEQLNIPSEAPPAFMLDAPRRSGFGPLVPRRFDNRSVSFPTDFPSANFLLSKGIKRVLLIQPRVDQPQPDLSHTLLRWQQGGIQIDVVGLDSNAPAAITIHTPNLFRVLWYRTAQMLGLRPQLGGFGGMIPVPSSG
jgi:hypothetical protein